MPLALAGAALAISACVSLDALRAGVGANTDASTDTGSVPADTSAKDTGNEPVTSDAGDSGVLPLDDDGGQADSAIAFDSGGSDAATSDAAFFDAGPGGGTCVVCEDFEGTSWMNWGVDKGPGGKGVAEWNVFGNAPSPTHAVQTTLPSAETNVNFATPTVPVGANELTCEFYASATADVNGGPSNHIFALFVTTSGATTQVFTVEGQNRVQFGEANGGSVSFSKQIALTTQHALGTFHKYKIRLLSNVAMVSVDDGGELTFTVPVKTPIDNVFGKFGTILTQEVIAMGGLPQPVVRQFDSIRCTKP